MSLDELVGLKNNREYCPFSLSAEYLLCWQIKALSSFSQGYSGFTQSSWRLLQLSYLCCVWSKQILETLRNKFRGPSEPKEWVIHDQVWNVHVCHRITEPQNGWFEVIWSNLSSSRGMKVEYSGPHPGDFGRYPKRLHHLWAICASAVNHRAQKCFLMLRWKFLCSSLCLLPLALALGTTNTECSLPSDIYKHWWNAPEPLLSRLNSPSFQSLLTWQVLQALGHLGGPLLESLQYAHIIFALEGSE